MVGCRRVLVVDASPAASADALDIIQDWELRLGFKLPAAAAFARVQSTLDPDAEELLVPAALLVDCTVTLRDAPLTASLLAEITGVHMCASSTLA